MLYLFSIARRHASRERTRILMLPCQLQTCYDLLKQLASSLFATTCIKSVPDNLHQVCTRKLASSLFATTCIKSVPDNLHQVCSRQLASSLFATTCIKSVRDNLHQVCSRQLGTSLLKTCNKLVVNKLSQAMRTHPDIGLLTTMLLQVVNKLVATWAFLAV